MRIVQKPTRDRAWLKSGCSHRDGDDIVGNGNREGSEEEADDAVAVEPGEYGIGHAGNRPGGGIPDCIAEEVDEEGEEERCHCVPDGYVEDLFLPAGNRLEEVEKGKEKSQEDHDIHRPDPFGVLPALSVAE